MTAPVSMAPTIERTNATDGAETTFSDVVVDSSAGQVATTNNKETAKGVAALSHNEETFADIVDDDDVEVEVEVEVETSDTVDTVDDATPTPTATVKPNKYNKKKLEDLRKELRLLKRKAKALLRSEKLDLLEEANAISSSGGSCTCGARTWLITWYCSGSTSGSTCGANCGANCGSASGADSRANCRTRCGTSRGRNGWHTNSI